MLCIGGNSFLRTNLAIDELDATISSQQLVEVSYTTAEMCAKFIIVVLTIQTSIIGRLTKCRVVSEDPYATRTMREERKRAHRVSTYFRRAGGIMDPGAESLGDTCWCCCCWCCCEAWC
jgi:hypothetical protein